MDIELAVVEYRAWAVFELSQPSRLAFLHISSSGNFSTVSVPAFSSVFVLVATVDDDFVVVVFTVETDVSPQANKKSASSRVQTATKVF